MSDFWSAIILGIVEGLTEFLPVSSTGHMILTGHLLGFTGEKAKTFEIVVQLGAVLAVLVLYWRRFVGFLNFKESFRSRGKINLIHMALAMLPAVVVGLAIHGWIKEHLFGPATVLISLVVGGVLILVAVKAKVRITAETMDDISYKQAFGIGLFQCLALWPGFSRSGSTISGGMLLGTSQKAAAEFTFLVSVPVMFGATGLDLYKSRDLLAMEDLGIFIAGLVASFVVAMIAVVTFLNIIKRLSLSWFAYYRFVLAAIFYIILFL
ncbi:undecaprenyl-diphosphate phosphatase [Paenibacillus puerhi]|uniref:undecaprenyl-diphosphate phosphatase n=1 Tax=Paenibacillus puerhi TaxID=2692622 RepID=UPI00135BAE07|nr:undecaprenyl-diphosphate phosphatase [Paenibacillus puerhi]